MDYKRMTSMLPWKQEETGRYFALGLLLQFLGAHVDTSEDRTESVGDSPLSTCPTKGLILRGIRQNVELVEIRMKAEAQLGNQSVIVGQMCSPGDRFFKKTPSIPRASRHFHFSREVWPGTPLG